MLRYVKHLRQAQNLTRRLNVVHNHVEASAGLSLQLHQLAQSPMGYATQAATSRSPSFHYEKSIQNLELQLRRSGRATKPDIERILGEIELAGQIPSLEGLLLVRCCGRPLMDGTSSESIELVQEVWNTLEKLNVPMDVSHYNTLLNVYIEKNHKFSPMEFMNMMLSKGIQLNRVTYQHLIAGFCQTGDIDGATKILSIMHEKGIPICENIFNSLITGHSEANDMESAIGILNTMKESGIQHSADTYGALLSAYAKRGDIDSINSTQKTMEQMEITVQDQHIMDVILRLAENGHTDKAINFSKNLKRDIISDSEVGRLIVQLVEVQQVDLAINILKNTTTDSVRHQVRSTFLIRSLITNKNYNNDQIIDVCHQLEKDNLHNRVFVLALYHALSNNKVHHRAIDLMKAWSKSGGEIREHYFWPLIREHTKQSDIDGAMDILKIMINDFNIVPSVETLREYVIPYMFGTYENIIEQLRSLNMTRDHVIFAIADRIIYERKLRNAAMFVTSYPNKYAKNHYLKKMVDSLNYRDDVKSFVIIMRFLTNDSTTIADTDNTSIEIVDDVVRECLTTLTVNKVKILTKLMNELVESGLSISASTGDELRSSFGDKLTPEIDDIIKKLTSGELKPVPMSQYNPYLNTKPKESDGNDVDQRGKYEMIDLRRQFSYNIEKKNNQAIHEILKKMENVGYSSAPVYAQAIDLFCDINDVDAATECIKKFEAQYPNGKLDHSKLLKYATLLIKNDRFADAIQFLSDKPIPEGDEKKSRGIIMKIRQLLEAVVETKHTENLQQLFNFLKDKNYVDIDNYILGPLVKIHIERNDLTKALDTFENLCIDYKCTPYKNVLASTFIDTEDANSLQKLTDLCTEIHGESNSLVDLALIFLECGRAKQAKKILDTSGIQVFNNKLTNSIERFAKNEKYDCLSQLTKITKDVVRLDRSLMYNTLLDVYRNKNDWQKGLALWTEMQEDNVQPTNYFLNQLSTLLKNNNQQVPFVCANDLIQTSSSSNTLSVNNNTNTNTNNDNNNNRNVTSRSSSKDEEQLTQALSRNDWAQAEDICRSSLNSKFASRRKFGRLIKALIYNNEIDRAVVVARSSIQECGIRSHVFGDLCDKLITEKRFDDVEQFGEILHDSLIDDISYLKILSKMKIINNGLLDFIRNFKIDVSADHVRDTEKKIHFGELAHGLLRDPSALAEYETWAQNLASNGITRAMQALWNFHFINNSPKADDLWSYIESNKSPLIRPIIDVALAQKDPVLIKKLTKKLDNHPQLNINSKCRAYTGLISVYTLNGQIDEALNVVLEVTKRYRIEVLSHGVLQKLKESAEQSGKQFPFVLSRRSNMSNNEAEQRLEGAANV